MVTDVLFKREDVFDPVKIRELVFEAAILLDRATENSPWSKYETWIDRVDLISLNMECREKCVIGQVFEAGQSRLLYEVAFHAVLDSSESDSIQFAFDFGNNVGGFDWEKGYENLTMVWTEEILRRIEEQ